MNPNPKIMVCPRGGPELEPYIQDLRDLKSELNAGGVGFEVRPSRSVDPNTTALILSVIGGVAAHYIVQLFEPCLRRLKETPKPAVRIVVEFKGRSYDLPLELSLLLEDLENTDDPKG